MDGASPLERLLRRDRIVTIAGITTRPDETWMLQIARNVTDTDGRDA